MSEERRMAEPGADVTEIGLSWGGGYSRIRSLDLVLRRDGTAIEQETDLDGVVVRRRAMLHPGVFSDLARSVVTLSLHAPDAETSVIALDCGGTSLWVDRGTDREVVVESRGAGFPEATQAAVDLVVKVGATLAWEAEADAPSPRGPEAPIEPDCHGLPPPPIACPQCGDGVLVTKRGRFGAFLGCSRHPNCTYVQHDGLQSPDQLPFTVTCPKAADGQLVARRARRTGNVFWGCSAYPRCDYTTSDEPTGAVHDAHDDGGGAVARRGEVGICLTCGASVTLPDGELVGLRLPGGPADPAAIERPAPQGRRRRTSITGQVDR